VRTILGVRPGQPRQRLVAVAIVVLVAVLARVLVVAFDDAYTPAHDAFDYSRHAVAIAGGDGFPPSGYAVEGGPSALRAPAYPYVLGLTYAALGVEADGGRALNIVLGGLTVLLVTLLGGRIAGFRAGLIAGLLTALFPPLVLLSRELYSENLFLPIVLAVALAALEFRESRRLRWAAAVGALCGLAALTRNPGPALAIPALVGLWWLRPRLSGRALAPVALALVAGIAVVLPWTARNAVEFGRFVPVTTSTGFALAGTYNLEAEQGPFRTSWRAPNFVEGFQPLFETAGVDEGTLDATLRREATEFIRANPTYVAEVVWSNGLRLFMLQGGSVVDSEGPVDQRGIGSGTTLGERIALALIAPFVLAGAFILARRHRRERASEPEQRTSAMALGPTAFVWLIPAFLLLSAALVAGLPRYRLPADPFLLILAAIAIERGWRWLAPRVARGGITRASGAIALAVVAMAGAGCGGAEDSGGGETTGGPAAPAEVSRTEFIAKADPICAAALVRTRRVVDLALSDPNLSAEGVEKALKEGLVLPGLEIRERLGADLAALPAPPPDPNLDTFLKLFPATEGLIRLRADATEQEDIDRIEGALVDLGDEQQDAARAYGLSDCAADFGSLDR
jgi:4-amino-4-deoxy-L-arabinose transferase-like glycosyltransferase